MHETPGRRGSGWGFNQDHSTRRNRRTRRNINRTEQEHNRWLDKDWTQDGKQVELTREWGSGGAMRKNTGEGSKWKNTRNREEQCRCGENCRLGRNPGYRAGLNKQIQEEQEKTGGKTEHWETTRRKQRKHTYAELHDRVMTPNPIKTLRKTLISTRSWICKYPSSDLFTWWFVNMSLR